VPEPSPAHLRRRKWLGVGIALASAAGLLYLSVPRTVAAFLALPGDRVFERVQRGETVSLAEVQTLAESRRRAVRWADWPSAWSDLGYAEHEIAYRRSRDSGHIEPALIDRALAATQQALAHAPLESEGWGRLALLRYVSRGETEAAAKAFGMALLTGPVRPKQVSYRLDLAFRLWPRLSSDDRALVARYARTSWRYAYEQIVATADTPARIGIMRAIYAPDPAILTSFEALLARRQKTVKP
jgi:hypothetical protein